MKKAWTSILALVLSTSLVSLGACRKSSDTTDKKTAAAEDKDTKKAASSKPPVDEGIDVPTEEDFEETASTQITETSDLNKELDQLEKEIGK
jgi:hypothetical protein